MDNKWFEFLKNDYSQGFPAFCGFEVKRVDHGVFDTSLRIRPEHRQQDGFVHAGVMATIADHTAGYAAYTTVSEKYRILTIEFKINYLRPAMGDTITCRSRVISGGRKVIVSESEIYAEHRGSEEIVSKAMVTLMVVPVETQAG